MLMNHANFSSAHVRAMWCSTIGRCAAMDLIWCCFAPKDGPQNSRLCSRYC